MSEETDDKKKSRKKVETVRERAERASLESSNPKKVEKSDEEPKKSKIKLPRRKSKATKDKKPRRFHLTPKFLRNAFAELKLVTWPDRRTTRKLTTAVIMFAIVFSAAVGLVDYVFGIIFKKVFLHG